MEPFYIIALYVLVAILVYIKLDRLEKRKCSAKPSVVFDFGEIRDGKYSINE